MSVLDSVGELNDIMNQVTRTIRQIVVSSDSVSVELDITTEIIVISVVLVLEVLLVLVVELEVRTAEHRKRNEYSIVRNLSCSVSIFHKISVIAKVVNDESVLEIWIAINLFIGERREEEGPNPFGTVEINGKFFDWKTK
jgi:hypothetical protein